MNLRTTNHRAITRPHIETFFFKQAEPTPEALRDRGQHDGIKPLAPKMIRARMLANIARFNALGGWKGMSHTQPAPPAPPRGRQVRSDRGETWDSVATAAELLGVGETAIRNAISSSRRCCGRRLRYFGRKRPS